MADKKDHITTAEDYQRYLNNQMSSKERHAFEKRMLEDDFESEALEGLSQLSYKESVEDLEILKTDLEKKTRKRSSAVYWRSAAAILLLGVFSFLVYYLINTNSTTEIAQRKENPVEDKSFDNSLEKPEIAHIDSMKEESSPVIAYQQKQVEEERSERQDLQSAEIKEEIPEPAKLQIIDSDDEISDEIIIEKEPPIDELPALTDEEDPGVVEGIKIEPSIEPLAKDEIMAISKSKKAEYAGDVSRRAMKAENIRTITGKITSVEDEEGIPGVNVILRGSSTGTVTDIEGNYSIKVPLDENVVLEYSYIGFVSEEVAINDQSEIDISMQPDITALSEIVVIGYGTQAKRDVTGAVSVIESDDLKKYTYIPPKPVNGNSSFKQYVKDNIQYPETGIEEGIKGVVKLKFTVGLNGQISNLEVVKSLGEAFDQEAMRLINEGPGWEPAVENDTVVQREVKVKIRFRPPEE